MSELLVKIAPPPFLLPLLYIHHTAKIAFVTPAQPVSHS